MRVRISSDLTLYLGELQECSHVSEHDGDLYLCIFVENVRTIDLERPIIFETKELLELSSVGNLSANPDANWLKNWLLRTNWASVFYSPSWVSSNIRINSFTGDKA